MLRLGVLGQLWGWWEDGPKRRVTSIGYGRSRIPVPPPYTAAYFRPARDRVVFIAAGRAAER